MKTIKQTVRHYYKYQYNAFVQPVLSSDGIIGGNNFAISVNQYYSSSYGWYAFDNNISTAWYPDTSFPYTCIMYNPNKLNITSFNITNDLGIRTATAGYIYGSNDNSTWTELKYFTNSVTTDKGQWSIDLSSNTEYYKYYKLNITATNAGNNGATIAEIKLNGTERVEQESTAQDYDFYKDVDVYKVPKISNTYYGVSKQ